MYINLVAFNFLICYNFDMKILVVSDTHGNVGPLYTAIDREKPDALIHLGDGLKDLSDVNYSGQIYAVKGNNDFNVKLDAVAKLEYNKCVILYMHGHEQKVKAGTDMLVRYAKIQGADIVLFGHTHTPVYFEQEGMIFVNPGALQNKENGTYAIIEFKDNKKMPSIVHKNLYKTNLDDKNKKTDS